MQAAQNNPAIAKAWGVIKVLSGDERAGALAEAREKARMDMDSWLDDARYEGEERGRREGRKEGRQEEKQEVARNLLQMNIPLENIVKATGLSLTEVERLAAELTHRH
ncbi:hypothetical protein AGMMS50256_23980 [Betaproteobacteria bacterium]|nr:hypothetical protein AGMMS50256_23980 [Betaproteobacteria bacterium]